MNWTGFEEMGGREVARGIGRWVAFHPEWKQDVGCAVVDHGGPLVLVDPLFPADPAGEAALDGLAARAAADGPPAIVLTVFFHERSAGDVLERIPGATLWADRESSRKIEAGVTNPFHPGDPLPGGLTAHATAREDEVVIRDPGSGTLFVGDVMLGQGPAGIELCPESWLPDGVGHAELIASLAPLLELPVKRILPGHGEPVLGDARAKLERILGGSRR
jgi:glyoxylase-like metal-dependent hydrolase (beta-lactamase superfamily II)